MKGIAILAVIIDHSSGLLYNNHNLQIATFFSVGLFVLVSGITTTLSIFRRRGAVFNKVYFMNRTRRLLAPYCMATVIVMVLGNKGFNLLSVLSALWRFNAQPQFYFIVFFLQLILIAPVLFTVLYKTMYSKHKYIFLLLETILITCAAYIFTKYTYILEVGGAGNVFLGGSFLVLFWLGMIWAFINPKEPQTFMGSMVGMAVSCTAICIYIPFVLWNKERMAALFQIFPIWTKNPSGTPYLLYCLLLGLALWFLYHFISKYCKKLQLIFIPFQIMGKKSMTIFLYHFLFLRWMMPQLQEAIPLLQQQMWLFHSLLLLTSVGLPMLGSHLYMLASKKIRRFFSLVLE